MNNKLKEPNTNIEEVIKTYGVNIRNIIMSITGSKNFQDIQQEVYIKLWKNFSKYKDQGKFSGWIKAVTVNTCKDHLRSKQFKQEQKTDTDEDNIIKIRARGITPDSQLLQSERQQTIINAIETLKPKLKEVIILYDIKEMTYEEISAKLKCPVGTVKSRLFSARKELYNTLKDLID